MQDYIFHSFFQAEGPPVQMEPVDLSVKTPVVLQVPKFPIQRLRNLPPAVKVHQPPGNIIRVHPNTNKNP